VERLQAEFYAAETAGEDTESTASSSSSMGLGLYDRNYRDVMLNLEIPTSDGAALICEVQVTLSGITILKKSEQAVYSLMRMVTPEELLQTYVFSEKTKESAACRIASKSTAEPEESVSSD